MRNLNYSITDVVSCYITGNNYGALCEFVIDVIEGDVIEKIIYPINVNLKNNFNNRQFNPGNQAFTTSQL